MINIKYFSFFYFELKLLVHTLIIQTLYYERKRQIIEFDGNAVTFSGVMEEVDTEHFVMK